MWKTSWRAFYFLFLIALSPANYGQDTSAIAEDFARLPQFYYPQLSPDGSRIAATIVHKGKPLLITRSLRKEDGNKISAINVGDLYLHDYVWANNERLIVSARSSFKFWGAKWNSVAMAAVNHDGTDPIFLPMYEGSYGYLWYTYVLHTLPDEPESVLAILDPEHESYLPKVSKVNIYTGRKEVAQRNFRQTTNWVADDAGNIRLAIKVDHIGNGRNVRIWHKAPDGKNFELLDKQDYFDEERIQPVYFTEEDPNVMTYITDSSYGELSESDNYHDHLLAMNVVTGELLGHYQEPVRKEVLISAKKAFGKAKKFTVVSMDQEKTLAIVNVHSDISPPEYYLYDITERKFSYLASSHPQLEKYTLSPMKELEYSARDGLVIPSYLTLPEPTTDNLDKEDEQKIPLIVMPHGGPWARDYWGFDNYVQYFASLGYGVFQPQFRGSTGFGVEHERAGYKEWGKKIQDDITDGVNWLIEEHSVDPDRICIVGASFGGYAAAMGLVKTPDLYQCGISINGVLDLPKLLRKFSKHRHSTINRMVSNKYYESKEFSPHHRLEEIKAPVLVIATKDDTIVDYKHSKDFYKKRKKHGEVEYLEIEGGEHWRTDETIELQVFAAMEKFLRKHLN